VAPGVRCAVNLQGVEVADLRRGDVLSHRDRLASTRTADVHLQWLAHAPAAHDITSVEVLVGTAERRAHLAAIGAAAFLPGQSTYARLHIDGPGLAVLPGDRFIVRGFAKSAAAGATLGGGVVLDAAPPPRRRSDPALLAELERLRVGDPAEGLRARVSRAGYAGRATRDLARESGLAEAEVDELLSASESAPSVLETGGRRWIDAAMAQRLERALLGGLDEFHAREPMRPGMPRAAMRGRLPENVPREACELAIARLEASGRIVREQDLVRLAEHRPVLDPAATAAAARIAGEAERAGLDPPSPKDWAEQLGVSLGHLRDLLAHLEREGELVRAPGDLWFARGAVEALRQRVEQHFRTQSELDTQTYKALIGTSRRTAMPLMELLDELHVTRRRGEVRVARAGPTRNPGGAD
jgi:selenocysteine-specific elongation factor